MLIPFLVLTLGKRMYSLWLMSSLHHSRWDLFGNTSVKGILLFTVQLEFKALFVAALIARIQRIGVVNKRVFGIRI